MRLLGCLVVAALSAAPTWAWAGESPEAFKGMRVGSFKLEGVPKDLKKPLSKGLVLSGESGLLSTRYPSFYPNLLDADEERIRLYLARNGFPYTSITPDLRRHKDKLKVTFHVDSGPPVLVDSLAIQGLGERGLRKARKAILTQPGEVFRQGEYEQTSKAIVDALGQLGYAAAKVEGSVTRIDSTRVAVAYDIEPGRIHYFGDVRVSGVPDDLIGLAHKSVAVGRGKTYNVRDVTQARDDLRLLGLFRQVRVETSPAGGDTLDVVAELTTREPRTAELGVGYWTDDGIRGHARWVHRNLFGGGRGLEVKGSASQYLIGASVATWWPSLVGPRTRVTLQLGSQFQNEDAYEQFSTGAEVSLSYRLSARSLVQGGVQLSNNTVKEKTEDPVFLEDAGLITSLLGNLQLDVTDDQLYPHRGSLTQIQGELSPPGVWTDNAFARVWMQRSDYFSLPRRTVFATKVGIGAAEPLGSSLDLIADRRFFSGGATSNRGFKRNRLGPQDSQGEPVGGNGRLDLSGELRFPLFSIMEAAVFADVGQVWPNLGSVNLADLETGVGPAIVFRTPVGPVRADIGFRVSSVSTDEPVRVLHVLIGNPY